MDDLLAQLRAEYRSQTEKASRLLDAAKSERRDLSESEAGQYQAATSELEDLSKRIATVEGHSDRERELQSYRSRQPAFAGAVSETRGEYRDPGDRSALEFFTERRGKPGAIELNFKGLEVVRNAQGRGEVLSLLEGSTSSALVPTSFRRILYETLVFNSAIRGVATVLASSSGERLVMPRVTTQVPEGTIVAEGGVINENDPTFGQGTLTSYKYANLIQVSTETEEDSAVDLMGYIARAMGRALGNGSGKAMVTGTGSGEPQGVLVGAGTLGQVVGGTPAANGATFTELVKLFDSITPPYQANGAWMVSQSALSKIRGLTNSLGNCSATK